MATDTKKESASQDAPPAIAVGDGGRSRRLKPRLSHKAGILAKKIALFILLLIVLTAVVIFLRDFSHRNVAFRIEGKNYSKASISAMAAFAVTQNGHSKQQQARNIFDLYETQVAAQKTGIIPNAGELKAAADNLNMPAAKTPDQKQYADLVTFNEALSQAELRYQQGGYEGLFFIFDFSQKLIAQPSDEKPIAGYGNQTLIQQDKQYANQQARAFYGRYKQNPSSADSLNAQVRALDKAGFMGGVINFGSATPVDLRTQIYYPGVYNYVISQTKPGLSGILTGQVETSLKPTSKTYAAGYYYFVDIKQAGRVISDPAGQIKDRQQKLKAAYYGI